MSNYDMFNLVLGGTGWHRFMLLTGNNLVSNPKFNNSIITQWSGIGAASCISRDADTTTFYGDYSLTIEDSSALIEEYARLTISLNSSIANKSFVVLFWCKGDSATDDTIFINGFRNSSPSNNMGEIEIPIDTDWKPYYAKLTANSNIGDTEMYIDFKPYDQKDGATATGKIYIDNVQVYEISSDYKLPQATIFNEKWIEQQDAQYKMIDGRTKTYEDGFTYSSHLEWQFVESTEQYVIEEIYRSGKLVFIPHIGTADGTPPPLGWLCRHEKNLERDYFQNKYIGYKGLIDLIGIDILRPPKSTIPDKAGGGDEETGKYTLADLTVS